MDREALKDWLRRPRYTWRWRPDAAETDADDDYCAVEATDAELRWYRWSHDIDHGGERELQHQSFADFRARGPCWSVPASILAELRAWIDEHGT